MGFPSVCPSFFFCFSLSFIFRTISIGSIPMLRRIFSISMALSSSVIFARLSWASRIPCSLSGVQNVEDYLLAAVNVAKYFNTVPFVLPGASVRDATWDALSSSVSCFEPFLFILWVACNRAMFKVFFFLVFLRSACQSWLELSIGGNCPDVLSKGSFVFRQSRVCVARSVKVSGSDKLIK